MLDVSRQMSDQLQLGATMLSSFRVIRLVSWILFVGIADTTNSHEPPLIKRVKIQNSIRRDFVLV